MRGGYSLLPLHEADLPSRQQQQHGHATKQAEAKAPIEAFTTVSQLVSSHNFSRRVAGLGFLSAFLLSACFFASISSSTPFPGSIPQHWLTLFEPYGWTRVSPARIDAAPAQVSSRWKPECLDSWLNEVTLCPQLSGAYSKTQFDVVLPWINGSDPLLAHWREQGRQDYLARHPELQPNARLEKLTIRHFREHDELRYSLRSLYAASRTPNSIRRIQVVTADVPAFVVPGRHDAEAERAMTFNGHRIESGQTIGQAPTWLDVDQLHEISPQLALVHHSQLFADPNRTYTPFFNSLAIEASLHQLKGTTDNILYSNDDVFMRSHLTVSDVGSSLTGPVFRMQRDLTVDGVPQSEYAGDKEGEWVGLKHANYLLDLRFGKRYRFYLAHISKTWNMPLCRELASIWRDKLDATAQSQFRGSGEEVQISFLLTHYVVERHREALLFSYWVARSDEDHDGTLSWAERQKILTELGLTDAESKMEAALPVRDTLSRETDALTEAGLAVPALTTYQFSSLDGYAGFQADGARYASNLKVNSWPARQIDDSTSGAAPVCAFQARHCLGEQFADPDATVSTNGIFYGVAFERPECGDCALLHLIGKSGRRGLSALLPPKPALEYSRDHASPALHEDEHVMLTTSRTWSEVDYAAIVRAHSSSPGELYDFVLLLMHRYAYVVGSTAADLIAMKSQANLRPMLARLAPEVAKLFGTSRQPGRPSAQVFAINDDLSASERESRDVDQILHRVFDLFWPDPAPWERRAP